MLRTYVKLAFGYRLNGVHRTYAVCEDIRGCNAKPWAVFYWDEPNGAKMQLSRWYSHRGWAERYIRKLHAEKQKHWVK